MESEFKKKGFSLLFSLIVHAAIIYLALTLISPLKVYIYEKDITKVVIIPPEKLYLPRLEKYPAGVSEFNMESPPIGLKKSGYKFSGAAKELESSQVAESFQNKVAEPSVKSDLSSGFRLDLRSRSKQGLSPTNELKLSLNKNKRESGFGEAKKSERIRNLNFLKYIYPGSVGIRMSGEHPRSRSLETKIVFQRGTPSFLKEGYDITPWAGKVVEKIQKNWLLTTPQKIAEQGEVGISVIVEENGKLTSIKIVNPSQVETFTRAALRAINLSLPFPRLPDDFPEEKLQVYFVFQYHD